MNDTYGGLSFPTVRFGNLWHEVGRQVKRLMLLQAPHLLQLVQLWIVLSRLQGPSRSSGTLPEMPYLDTWLQLPMLKSNALDPMTPYTAHLIFVSPSTL